MEIILLIRCSAVARTLLSRPVMAEQRVNFGKSPGMWDYLGMFTT